jgi:hypothetical protein
MKLLKSAIFAAITLLFAPQSFPADVKKMRPVTGLIGGPKGMSLGGYMLYFNGYQTMTNPSGRFQIQTHTDLTQEPLYLLVSSGVEWACKPGSKTAGVARQDAKKPYKFYSIQLNQPDPNKPAQMEVNAETLDSRNFELPIDRCVILPINAHFVEDIKAPKNFELGGVFTLPKIVLQDEARLQETKSQYLLARGCPSDVHDHKKTHLLKRGLAKGWDRSLAWRQFHEPVSPQVRKTKNRRGRPVEITIYANQVDLRPN